jgi:hypothetical protein
VYRIVLLLNHVIITGLLIFMQWVLDIPPRRVLVLAMAVNDCEARYNINCSSDHFLNMAEFISDGNV